MSGRSIPVILGEGAVISRNWVTAHFLSLGSWCLGCVTQLAVVFQWVCTEAQGRVEVNPSAIVYLFGSNQFTSCLWAVIPSKVMPCTLPVSLSLCRVVNTVFLNYTLMYITFRQSDNYTWRNQKNKMLIDHDTYDVQNSYSRLFVHMILCVIWSC